MALLPTPSASSYGSNQGGAAGRVGPVRHGLNSIDKLLPTPTVNDSRGGRNSTANRSEGTVPFFSSDTLCDVAHRADFGPYEDVVKRWEAKTRPAPDPLLSGRLSADFVEWMMGFDEGWTAIDGAKKTHRLKALGNAVVFEQGAAAWLGLGGPVNLSTENNQPDAENGRQSGNNEGCENDALNHPEKVKHPAKFSNKVLEVMDAVILEETLKLAQGDSVKDFIRLLDPFAGVGRVHELERAWMQTWGVEIEHEWANQNSRTIVGDARALPLWWTEWFDIVATSPTYGNRMADHHEAKDVCRDCHNANDLARQRCHRCGGSGLSKRLTYRHTLGRALSDGNSGSMQFGHEYRMLHIDAWREVRRVLKKDGLFLLNVSNHIRNGEEVKVAEWHRDVCLRLGFSLRETLEIETPRMGFGANRNARVSHEKLYVFTR